MIFPQFDIYVLIYDYLKFRKDPSITSQEIANYISVVLAVAMSVYWRVGHLGHVTQMPQTNFRSPYPRRLHRKFVFDRQAVSEET